jgi:hypothetical protein
MTMVHHVRCTILNQSAKRTAMKASGAPYAWFHWWDLPGMPCDSIIKRIGWLTLPKAIIGLKGQFQALANPTNSTIIQAAAMGQSTALGSGD